MKNHFPKLLGVDIPQTDFDQRAIHRGLLSEYRTGRLSREKIDKARPLKDIAADFALLRLRCSRTHRRKSWQFT